MRTMSATIQIDAAPMRVWAILTDLSRSPEWNPLFRSAAGEVTLTRPGSAGVGPLWEVMAPRKSRTPPIWQSKRMIQRKDVRRVIPVLVAHAAITALPWRDLRRPPEDPVRGSKRLWRVASAMNTVGSAAYRALGRKRSHAD